MSSGPLPSLESSVAARQDELTAVHDTSQTRMPAALTRALADFAAAIAQIETVLAANENSAAADVHFAAERIHDIAAALRQREVEAALCDALEAAMREIGDAIVRHDAASARATGAAPLLKELAQRVQTMMALIGFTGERAADAQRESSQDSSLADAAMPAAAAETEQGQHAPRPDDAAQSAAASVLSIAASGEDKVRVVEPVLQTLPDSQAELRAGDDTNEQRQPLSLPIPEPLEGEKKNNRLPGAQSEKPEHSARALRRATSHESLAVLQALSEEELIALFG